MDKPSNVLAGATRVADPSGSQPHLPEDWRLARATHLSLSLLGMPRVNLLLIGIDDGVWSVLETLALNLREPIITWSSGKRLVLPQSARPRTLILHNVGALACDDQQHLLEWLDRTAGRVQVVSTTSAPLLPRVRTGAFDQALYYRLNTICVDVTV